jgi:hypothetical protein
LVLQKPFGVTRLIPLIGHYSRVYAGESGEPASAGPNGPKDRMFRFLAQDVMHGFGGRPYRYNCAATNKPGW